LSCKSRLDGSLSMAVVGDDTENSCAEGVVLGTSSSLGVVLGCEFHIHGEEVVVVKEVEVVGSRKKVLALAEDKLDDWPWDRTGILINPLCTAIFVSSQNYFNKINAAYLLEAREINWEAEKACSVRWFRA